MVYPQGISSAARNLAKECHCEEHLFATKQSPHPNRHADMFERVQSEMKNMSYHFEPKVSTLDR